MKRRNLLPLALAPLLAPAAAQQPADAAIHLRHGGDGAPIWVLLHPFSASGRFWEARAAALAAEHRVRVISPDLPSHGRSRIVERFDYDAATAAVESALAPWRDGIALVVGASSGGIVALKLAARLRCPVAAVGVGFSFSADNVAAMRASARELPPPAAQFATAFAEQGDAQRAAIQRHFGDLAALGDQPLIDARETAALARRTLLINGSADDFFTRASVQVLADAIPGAVLTLVGGAGHLEPLAAVHRDFTWASVATFARTHAPTRIVTAPKPS